MTVYGAIIDWTGFNEFKANCFIKNGEEFIVLPHLLQSSFRNYSSEQIEKACDELNIKLLLCDSNELSALKFRGILPKDCVRQVGIIRRSDAERLYKYLTLKTDLTDTNVQQLDDSAFTNIPIQHHCFGSQSGKLFPHLYKNSCAQCILCDTCKDLFSPSSFVGHTHTFVEIHKVVHWGFDSSNWRYYICIDERHENYSFEFNLFESAQMLENVKRKFFHEEVAAEQCSHRLEKLNSWNDTTQSLTLTTLPEPPAILTERLQLPWPEHIERDKPVALSEDSVPVGLIPNLHDVENYRDRVPNISLKPVKIKSVKDASRHVLSQSNSINVNLSPRADYLKSFQQRVVRRTATEDISYTQRVCTNAQLALVKAIFAISESTPTTSSHLLRLFEDVKRSHQLIVSSIQQETQVLRKRLAEYNVDMEQMEKGINVNNPSTGLGDCNNGHPTLLGKSETTLSVPDHESVHKNNSWSRSRIKRKALTDQSACPSESIGDESSRDMISSNKKRVWITSYEGESDYGKDIVVTENQSSNTNVPNVA